MGRIGMFSAQLARLLGAFRLSLPGALLAPLIVLGLLAPPASATLTGLPSGFLDEAVATGLPFPTNVAFMPDGKLLVTLKAGKVLIYQGSTNLGTLIDISEIVHDNWDRGLLGIAVHPDFATTSPYVYLLYTYDPPGVTKDTVDPGYTTDPSRVSQLMRITVDNSGAVPTEVPNSRVILLGNNSTRANIGNENDSENIAFASCMNPKTPTGTPVEDCIPADGSSHSIGTAIFGRGFGSDGSPQPWSLYLGNGDNSSFYKIDPRALRSQNLDSLSGKILRIDPLTGAGLPDNPFYNPLLPDSNRSKVYAYGLRNPFRFTINPASGEPFIGDVGWNNWEEINTGKGANFGWPCYEGATADGTESSVNTASRAQGSYAGNISTQATCNGLYAQGGGAVKAPIYSYVHAINGVPVGAAAEAGVFYTGTVYPASYQGALFIADFSRQWIRYMTFDGAGNPTVHDFGVPATGTDGPVLIIQGPDTNLYWLQYGSTGGTLWRIRYTGAGNTPPTAVLKATPLVGVAPLSVNFDGSASFDPDGQALTYRWSVDDGTGDRQFSTKKIPVAADLGALYPGGLPTGIYTVTLKVTDTTNVTGTATAKITSSTNPPQAIIDQPVDGTTFKVGDVIKVHACATLGGQPVPSSQQTWEQRLHHNQHVHYDTNLGVTADPAQSNCSQFSYTVPQHGDDMYLEMCVTVTAGSLSDTQCRSLQPQRPDPGYTLASTPLGMLIQYENEGLTIPGPTLIHPVVNSLLTATVSDVQQHRTFTGWLDDLGNVLSASPSYTFTVGTAAKTFAAQYQNFPPTARVTALDPLTGTAPLTLRFDGTKSTDPEGDTLAYTWDAGAAGSSNLAQPSLTFPTAGTYAVNLTVADQLGATGAAQPVNVTVVANPAGNQLPTVALTAPADGSTAPSPITLTAQASDTGGSVSQVDFYAGSVLLGTDTTAPYSFTWNNATAGTYSLRALATDNSGAIAASAPIAITVSAAANLALNKPAVASSLEGAQFAAGAAVDGNGATRWSSQFGDPQWIYVDLGGNYTINRVKLTWEAASSKAFQIQVSADAATWTTIYTTTTGNGGIQDLTGLNGTGRYVRMYGTSRNTVYGHSLWEFEVYGSLAGPNPLPDVVVTALSYAGGNFTAQVKNQGTAATPNGVVVGIAYFVDGVNVTWGYINGPIAAGATATIGTNGGAYTMPAGTHSVMGYVDDVNRFAESDDANNQLTVTYPPTGGSVVTVTKPANQNGTVGTAANLQITASDSANGTLAYAATGLPNGLTIAPTTGLISGTPTTAGTFNPVITVTSSAGGTGTTTFGWTVTGGGTPLPDVIVTAVSYAGGNFTAQVKNQGTAATPTGVIVGVAYFVDGIFRTWGIIDGPLAPGATATIGTNGGAYTMPAGNHSVMAYVDDVNRFAESDDANNQLTVTYPPTGGSVVTVTKPANQNGTVGTAANLQITASDSANGTLAYAATGLPNGLTIAPTTGLISGTPTTAGTFNPVITVTSSAGGTGTTTFGWTIADGGTPGINLALGKPAVASSIEKAQLPASAAFDGDPATRWSSQFSDPQWVYVDLGANYNVNRVTLTWEAASSKAFQIQVSPDAANWTSIYTTANANGGSLDLTGLNGTGRYVRMYGQSRNTVYGHSLWEFEVYGTLAPNTGNLALNKPALASSAESSVLTASKAFDGNALTRWSSQFADPQWLQVDLGAVYNINRVNLLWEAAYSTAYVLEVSTDAVTWTQIYSTSAGNGGTDDLTSITGVGRYVRIVGNARGTVYGHSLWELEVYGTPWQ